MLRDPFAIRFLPRELALAVRAGRVPALRRALEWYADHDAVHDCDECESPYLASTSQMARRLS
ncbi:MAG: hypothetical protein ABI678_05650, partial [Kofleriaceae bacterium]